MITTTRRQFMAGIAATSGLLATRSWAFNNNSHRTLKPIPVIDTLNSAETPVRLDLQMAQHNFGNGTLSDTFGINGTYLGPIVRVRKGQETAFELTNKINEPAAIHWHGLHIPGSLDGGPHQALEVGATWKPVLPIANPASLNFYHAHTHGSTGYQVYQGLAGVLIVEDDNSLAADMPKTMGVDDFVLVLQDKKLDSTGSVVFSPSNVNDTLAVNGTLAPTLQKVAPGLVRLRILNASNGAFIKLSLSENQPMHVIASDGGFLTKPVSTDFIILSPGERYEILVDASHPVSLMTVRFDDEEITAKPGIVDTTSKTTPVMAVALVPDKNKRGFTGSLPTNLSVLPAAEPKAAQRIRSFDLSEDVPQRFSSIAPTLGNRCYGKNQIAMGINGRPMDMNFINEAVPTGEYEIWRVTSQDGAHPFHIHGCSFRILKQMGVTPPDYASGWKDMIYAAPGSVSELLVKFDHKADSKTPYMYHCHILKHEDCGMMGQFTVEDDATPYSAPVAV